MKGKGKGGGGGGLRVPSRPLNRRLGGGGGGGRSDAGPSTGDPVSKEKKKQRKEPHDSALLST